MGVRRADEPEAVGIESLLGLHGQAVAVSLPNVAAGRPARLHSGHLDLHQLEVGPLVVGRKQRMGVRGALDLCDLHQGLVAHALLGIRGIHGRAVHTGQLEHQPVGAVGVVRYRQRFHTQAALGVHPRPQVLRVAGVHAGKRQLRGGVPKNHVAVKVLPLGSPCGVFVSHEAGKPARIVVALCCLHGFLPGRAKHRGIEQIVRTIELLAQIGKHGLKRL